MDLIKSIVRLIRFFFSNEYYLLLLTTPQFRNVVGKIRLAYFRMFNRKLRTFDSENAFGTTVDHNMKNLSNFAATRMGRIIEPLCAIESLSRDSDLLVVGPRNEADLLWLTGKGFERNRIRGLDLISYSNWIVLGDMHNIPFDDNSFDALIIGWTLTYSNSPASAAAEAIRVVRPGGLVAIGVEYVALNHDETAELLGYAIADREFDVINSTDKILSLFRDHIEHVFWNHDAPLKKSHTSKAKTLNPSSAIVIFSISK